MAQPEKQGELHFPLGFSYSSSYLEFTDLYPSFPTLMQTSSQMSSAEKADDNHPVAVTVPAGSSYQLQKLRSNHHLILQLAATGMKNKDIAKRIGCTEQTVHYTLNSEVGKEQLQVLLGKTEMASMNITKMFQELSPVAVQVIEEIMLSEWAKHSDKLKAAERVLDGAGHGKRTNVDVNVRHFTDADISAAKQLAKAKLIDAEYSVEDAQVLEPEEVKPNGKPKRSKAERNVE